MHMLLSNNKKWAALISHDISMLTAVFSMAFAHTY